MPVCHGEQATTPTDPCVKTQMFVMTGLVPAIHVFLCGQDVDALHKSLP